MAPYCIKSYHRDVFALALLAFNSLLGSNQPSNICKETFRNVSKGIDALDLVW